MVFKKDLTPLRKGGAVIKHRGKGASTPPPNPMGQLTGRYPKPAPVAPGSDTAVSPDSPLAPPLVSPAGGMGPQPLAPPDDGT